MKTKIIALTIALAGCNISNDGSAILSESEKTYGEQIAYNYRCQEQEIELVRYDDSVCEGSTERLCYWQKIVGPKANYCNGYEPDGHTIDQMKRDLESCGVTVEKRIVDQSNDTRVDDGFHDFSTDFLIMTGSIMAQKVGENKEYNYGGWIIIRHKEGIDLSGCKL